MHVYFSDDAERAAAMELREKLQARFGGWMRFYAPKDRPIGAAAARDASTRVEEANARGKRPLTGPHPLPMWEADFGAYEHRSKWTEVRDFLLENNPDGLSILIHPHSTDSDYVDHTEHAWWAGEVLELRMRGPGR